jgi:2-phosphosulfolactate phosphatase
VTRQPGIDDQAGFEVRFDWGLAGAKALAPVSGVVVVVDVLSFSTAVEVALARGATVIPVPWKDARAAVVAAERGGVLAVGRGQMSAGSPYSLSPASLLGLPSGSRLVLPSPNGATITSSIATLGAKVLIGCLRNASAVATVAKELGGTVSVVAAGERWGDGSLRPALEDLVGAGTILNRLSDRRYSPEACAAIAVAGMIDPATQLLECASGRELAAAGFAQDVQHALEVDVSDVVPLLREGVIGPYRQAPGAR